MSVYSATNPDGAILDVSGHVAGVLFTAMAPSPAGVVTVQLILPREIVMELAGELAVIASPALAEMFAQAGFRGQLTKEIAKAIGDPAHAFTAAPLPRCEELAGEDANGAGVQCELPKGHLGPHQVRERDRDSGNGVTS